MNHIQSSIANGVLHATFQRPERKNALTSQMYAALASLLEKAAQNDDVKVLLLSGAAGVFTAGNDLDDFIEYKPEHPDAAVFRFMRAIATFPKPLLAAVQGLAIGVGTTLLLHCDLVYVADDTRFSLPFVNLGLVPEAGSSLLLPRLAGHQRAMEKLWFGEVFTAADAQALGFVNQVMPSSDVLAFALEQAERLAKLPTGSVCGTKRLVKGPPSEASANPLLQRIDQEAQAFIERVGGPATLEAIAAFKAKRKPDFEGMN